MSNKIEQALRAAINAMELANISCEHFHHEKKHQHLYGEKCIPEELWKDALNDCKSALSELEKYEPVATVMSVTDEEGNVLCHGLNDVLDTNLPQGTKLFTSPQKQQREGWVSVPIEPTEEMLKSCDIDMSARNTAYSFHDHLREYYKAMIQAAPTDTE